jgi:hypothetical protein
MRCELHITNASNTDIRSDNNMVMHVMVMHGLRYWIGIRIGIRFDWAVVKIVLYELSPLLYIG